MSVSRTPNTPALPAPTADLARGRETSALSAKHGPERTCVGCRQQDDQPAMRRVVLDAAGRLVLQRAGKLAGRGAYVHWNEVCLAAAVTRGGFDRSFRRKVLFPKTSPPYQFLLRDEETLGQDQRN